MSQDKDPVEPQSSAEEETKKPQDGPKATWEYRDQLRINTVMKDLLKKTIEATEKEIDALREKLDRIQRGG